MADQTAAERLAAAQAALAQAQADAAAEAKATAAEGESQAAVDAEAALGKGIGGYVADLIRRLEALEAKVFPKQEDPPSAPSEVSTPTSGSATSSPADYSGGYQ
jgi:hypothetical protein